MGISYKNVLLLRDLWAMHGLERCSICPDEISNGEPSINIIDNDEFTNDTWTGGGTTHRTDWMFLQRLERLVPETHNPDEQECIGDAMSVSHALADKASQMQVIAPYRTIKRGEPSISPEPTTFLSSTERQRKRGIVHALTRAHVNGNRPEAATTEAERIICVNDPYDAPHTTKDSEQDLRIHGKEHIPNVYMELNDPFSSA